MYLFRFESVYAALTPATIKASHSITRDFYVQRETNGTHESLLCSVMNGQTLVYVGCFYHAWYTCLFDRREKKRSCPWKKSSALARNLVDGRWPLPEHLNARFFDFSLWFQPITQVVSVNQRWTFKSQFRNYLEFFVIMKIWIASSILKFLNIQDLKLESRILRFKTKQEF